MLYSAKSPGGKPLSGYVEAADATEASERLAQKGLAEVVLHQIAPNADEAELLDAMDPHTLDQLAKLQIDMMKQPTLLTMLAGTARSWKWWNLVCIAMAAAGIATGKAWLWIAAVVLLALPFAVTAWTYRHSGRYTRLLRAFALGQWKEFESLVEKLKPMRERSQQLDFDLDVRRACLRAKRGKLDEALHGLQHWQAKLAGQPGLFEMRVASVYHYGGDRQGMVTQMGLAHAAAPSDPAKAIDCALAHARWGDVVKAEALLRAVDTNLLPPFAAPFVSWIDGLVALRRDRPEALDILARAMEGFLGWSGNPAAWVSLAHCAGDYALALSFAGHKAEAEATLSRVLPILRHHVDKPLMQLLQKEIPVAWAA